MTAERPLARLLDGFENRVLVCECPAPEPQTLDIMPPLTVSPGGQFSIHVAALHEGCEPSTACDWEFDLDCPEAGWGPVRVRFRPGQSSVAVVENVVLEREGVFRFRAVLAGEVMFSSPVVCRANLSWRIKWGDPHIHTILGDCHPDTCRSLAFAYIAGRRVSGLDWIAVTDHVSNGRCDRVRWMEQGRACDNFDDAPSFVTLPAYEASLRGGCGGDNNVYLRRRPEMFIDQFDGGHSGSLFAALADVVGAENALVVPHHTTRTGKHGEIPAEIYPGIAGMPLVEIASLWGVSEYRGNPDPLKQVHAGPSYIQDLLGQGLPLGFLGGTDTHTSLPFRRDNRKGGNLHAAPAGTGVYIEGDFSRDSLFDALRARQTYAGTHRRTYLDVTVNGLRPGAYSTAGHGGRLDVQVEAAGADRIVSLDVVTNGETLHRLPGTDWHMCACWQGQTPAAPVASAPFGGEYDYVYVRAVYADGARAWSSPVWMKR